jgi:hypothetical protein
MKRAFLVFFLAITLFYVSNAHAADVDVSVYILNLGKFDVSTGSFTADFYLSMKCDNCSPAGFEFMNGRATSVDKITDTADEVFYRIQGSFNNDVDLKRFPFDSQHMLIIIEDKMRTSTDINYVPDDEQSGIDEAVIFSGWNLDGWHSEVREHYYPVYDENYSQYKFSVDISRIAPNSFLKTFLPVFFIVMVVLFTFLIDPDKITTRLTVAGSSLVAAVMFHVTITNQIPPVGYLTFADKFMIMTYLVLLYSFVINIVMLELQERKRPETVEKLHRRTEFATLGVVAVLYALLFIFFI